MTTSSKHTTDLIAQANEALATLHELMDRLPIDDAIPPQSLGAARVSNRVPLEVLSIPSDILNEDPLQYPQFDAAEAKVAIEFERAMQLVVRADAC